MVSLSSMGLIGLGREAASKLVELLTRTAPAEAWCSHLGGFLGGSCGIQGNVSAYTLQAASRPFGWGGLCEPKLGFPGVGSFRTRGFPRSYRHPCVQTTRRASGYFGFLWHVPEVREPYQQRGGAKRGGSRVFLE